jgi:hypothetical protein
MYIAGTTFLIYHSNHEGTDLPAILALQEAQKMVQLKE